MNSLLHLIRFMVGIDSPQSQVTEQELNLLVKYAKGCRTVVELGCYEGRTTVALAKVASGLVYSVDPFSAGRLGIRYGKLIAAEYARRHGMRNVNLIGTLSWEAVTGFHKDIDLLFIDADHTHEAISRDWNDWTPKVRVGGYVALHDVRKAVNSPHDLGSMRFFEENVKHNSSFTEVDAVDSITILKKLN